MGGRAQHIIESKVQWKPFWLATQQYPQNDWLGGKFPYTMTYAHDPHLLLAKQSSEKPALSAHSDVWQTKHSTTEGDQNQSGISNRSEFALYAVFLFLAWYVLENQNGTAPHSLLHEGHGTLDFENSYLRNRKNGIKCKSRFVGYATLVLTSLTAQYNWPKSDPPPPPKKNNNNPFSCRLGCSSFFSGRTLFDCAFFGVWSCCRLSSNSGFFFTLLVLPSFEHVHSPIMLSRQLCLVSGIQTEKKKSIKTCASRNRLYSSPLSQTNLNSYAQISLTHWGW